MRDILRPALLMMVLLSGVSFAGDKPVPAPGAKGTISAPVAYEDLMLVLSTKDGIAAVAFGKEVEKGVTYRYRFVPQGKEKEESGEGKVFEKYKLVPTKDPDKMEVVDEGSQLFLKAGPIKVEWSYSMAGRGWIYYTPEVVRVQIANAKEFEKVDLKRFMK